VKKKDKTDECQSLNLDVAPKKPTECSADAVEVEIIAVVASSEINQNVGGVITTLAELQVAVVLPDRHCLVNEAPNLSGFSSVARDVFVHEPDRTQKEKRKAGRTNSINRVLFVIVLET
jgi:hypothetical protein